MVVELSTHRTLLIAILVLFIGKFINRRVPFFRNYDIPEPVTGGLFASIVLGLLHAVEGVDVVFDTTLRDSLLLAFFTSLGLSAKLDTLVQGGRTLVIFLGLLILALLFQNTVGVTIASLLGLEPLIGLISGSVSLSGGHGTAIAWAPVFEKYGITNAMELGTVCATFGLVLGGFTGGPLAERLIRINRLKSSSKEHITIGSRYNEEHEPIDAENTLLALFTLVLAMVAGATSARWLVGMGIQIPEFVGCLFAGILVTNLIPKVFRKQQWSSTVPSLAVISDVCLGLFLAMSLMSMQLWTLASMAGPLFILLMVQTCLMLTFTWFVVYRLLGRDFDAAVMSSGMVGIGLGATPNAMANMTAVTQHYGASPKAFIVVPLAGAFFIDIVNSVVIRLFIDLLA
ncbi:sodium/glutamate symporter [Kistimonas scapharcae]|uniref:Sodium/glutamate symporter n=2 Tax=cellular organisms TaxID=131567 RepID=A0ABP8VAM3_9GAMM